VVKVLRYKSEGRWYRLLLAVVDCSRFVVNVLRARNVVLCFVYTFVYIPR